MLFNSGITDILHPISVHFPVALTLTGLFLAVIYLIRKKDPMLNMCSRVILILAAVSAWVAIITSSFTPSLSGEAATIRNIHHVYAFWFTFTVTAAAVIYLFILLYHKPLPAWVGWLGFIFYVLAGVFISFTGYYGGYIVYNILL
ncbi:MAG: DUF2231 domain-containing protein [Bacteroidales bacterium]